jgi:hypothetical protein
MSEKITTLKKTFTLPPFAKKAAIWGGAILGVIAVGALAFVTLNKDDSESDEAASE